MNCTSNKYILNSIYFENLKLRLENHRLKKKIRHFRYLVKLKKSAYKNIIFESIYDFNLLKFIAIANSLNKIFKNLQKNKFDYLTKIIESNFVFKLKLIKKTVFGLIDHSVQSKSISEFLRNIFRKFFYITLNTQIIFKKIKFFLDEILVQKFYYLLTSKTVKKTLITEKKIFSDYFKKTCLVKFKINKILNSSFVLQQQKIDCEFKKTLSNYTGILRKNRFVKLQILLRYLNSNKFKISAWKKLIFEKTKYQNTEIFDNFFYYMTVCIDIIKKINENFFLQINKRKKNIFEFLKILTFFFYKLKSFREFFKKIQLYINILLLKGRKNKIKKNLKNKSVLFRSFWTNLYIIKIFQNQIISYELKHKIFLCILLLKKFELKYHRLVVFSDFYNLFNIKKNEKISFFEKKNNFHLVKIKPNIINCSILLYRASDINKELFMLWNIIKFKNYGKNCKNPFKIDFFKSSYINLFNKYLKIKKLFNYIILSLKKKTFIIQKKCRVYKEIIYRKEKDRCKIEEKLFEIKSMELDFSYILKQIAN